VVLGTSLPQDRVLERWSCHAIPFPGVAVVFFVAFNFDFMVVCSFGQYKSFCGAFCFRVEEQ
jgi:hypothetical protein